MLLISISESRGFLSQQIHVSASLQPGTRSAAPGLALFRQSLYPSMMIAYNLCYTTILGKFDPKTGGTSGHLGALPYPESDTAAALVRAAEAHQAWQCERSGSSQASDSTALPGTTPGVATPREGSKKAVPAHRGGGMQYPPSPGVAGFSPSQPQRGSGTQYPPSPSVAEFSPTQPAGGRGDYAPSPRVAGVSHPQPAAGAGDYSPSPSMAGFSPPQPAGDGKGRKGWNPRSIHVAPNTAGFCHPSLRVGVLPLMLREILETRVMIKGAMRRAEEAGQRVLARTLNARQFALKMISNVTYG